MKRKVFALVLISILALVGVSMGMLRNSNDSKDVQASPLYEMTLNSALWEFRDEVSSPAASIGTDEDAQIDLEPEQKKCTKEPQRTICPKVQTQCEYTKCPEAKTECPVNPTNCPKIDTVCPLEMTKCPKIKTLCPSTPTKCEWTKCPMRKTVCPVEPTKCPKIKTKCRGADSDTMPDESD